MTWIREMTLGFLGISFGLMVAGGVFTVLFVVGLIPRFAGKTDTARYEVLYEEFIIAGSAFGCILSIFEFPYLFGKFMQELPQTVFQMISFLILAIVGIFSGMFVGCLALALEEMIDSIPIFTRRIGFRHGLGIVVWAVALGKICGSLLYFGLHLFE